MVQARSYESTSPQRVRFMRWMTVGVLFVAAAGAAVSVHAQGRGIEGGRGAPGMMMFGGPPEHVARAVDHLLDGLAATDAQRGQVKQIAQAVAVDLKAQHEAGRSLRDKGMQIFTAPVIDAAAAESVRQQMLAQYDQASKRTLQAMLDIGKVLTPEQRAKLGERMRQRQVAMQVVHRVHHEKPEP